MRYSTILLALFCAACGSYSANVPTIKPYKMDIQQGNVVTSKMMMQLRPGMTKSQVRFIMGTPLLVDSFHADRWDYFYQMRKDGKIIEQRRVMLEFDADTLARVRGDVIPATSDTAGAAEAPAKPAQAKSVKPATREKEKGWLDKLKFWGDDKDKADAQPQPQPEQEAAPVAAVPAKPAPKQEPAQPAAAAEQAQPEQPQEKLPPLMDPAMQPKPEPAEVAPQSAQPAVKIPAPAPAEQPANVAKPAAATEQPAAVPTSDTEKTVRPEAKSKSKKAKATTGKPAPEPKAMTAPEPPKDLPPEDAPDFFEKMLEKIGF